MLNEELKDLAATTDNPAVKKAIENLRTAISVGNISNSTGLAFGENIRMVVNNLNLPPDVVAKILGLRNEVGAALVLDADRYRLDTLLFDKTRDFVGRAYVFDAINHFIANQPNGYFVIEGDPGMGKSTILAEYVRRTGCISHFNVRAMGLTSARQFIENVCTQIIVDFGLPYPTLPAEATQDGAFLLKLLKEASAKLEAGDQLVVAVDALDEADPTSQSPGANILYLPSTLPDGVYFILTRRNVDLPVVTQSPQQELDLMAHAAENRKDVEFYIRRNSERVKLREWMTRQNVPEETFVITLADLAESNFMYLRHVLPEIETGVYQSLNIEKLPVGLLGYYEDHWRHMGMTAKPLPRVKIRTIYVMCEVRQSVSRKLISEFATDQAMQVDELAVQEVLDEWSQFLHEIPTPDGIRYSIYHSSFREFLHRKEVVQAAGVTIKDINALIADNLWQEFFGKQQGATQ